MLERNSVNYGDCLDVMSQIDDNSIDMILCDMPYGVSACRWDTVIPFEPLWAHYRRIAKKDSAIVLTATQPFTSALIMSNPKEYRATWYWMKERGTNFVQAKRYPMKVVEECVVFCKGTPQYHPIMTPVKPYNHAMPRKSNSESQHMDSNSLNPDGSRIIKQYNEKFPTNVLRIPRDNMHAGRSLHPTQKPIALFEYLIKTYSCSGQIVLDNCAGSGTTAIACMNTGRDYLLIENNETYIDVIHKRIAGRTAP